MLQNINTAKGELPQKTADCQLKTRAPIQKHKHADKSDTNVYTKVYIKLFFLDSIQYCEHCGSTRNVHDFQLSDALEQGS